MVTEKKEIVVELINFFDTRLPYGTDMIQQVQNSVLRIFSLTQSFSFSISLQRNKSKSHEVALFDLYNKYKQW